VLVSDLSVCIVAIAADAGVIGAFAGDEDSAEDSQFQRA